MSEHIMETRRRSRSKTPFLRSNCDHENCDHAGEEGHVHHKKKTAAVAPTVKTIIEEEFDLKSKSSKLINQKTSDYSSEDVSPESKAKKIASKEATAKENALNATSPTTTTTKTTSTTIVTKTKRIIDGFGGVGTGTGVGAVTSTPKSKTTIIQENITKNTDATKSAVTAKVAALNNSLTQNSFTRFFSNTFGSNKSNNDLSVNSDEHLAYLDYKRAGEYWKTTPKTDYTYSKLSPHRRELAPGIIAMPNMSRKSLENHNERITYMIEREPAKEEYIRRRYETSKFAQNRQAAERLAYDSGDDVDYDGLRQNIANQWQTRREAWYKRFITTIITTITNVWTTVSGGGSGGGVGGPSYRKQLRSENRGVLGAIRNGVTSTYMNVFRRIYMLIASILSLDTWLLQSSNPENKNKKRFLLFLLILLPLLLLAGLFYYLHPNEPFPPKHFSEYNFTLPTLPALPDLSKFNVSEYLNAEQYESVKSETLKRLSDIRDWTDDYVLYLRTVSQNIADEAAKLFRREQNYERV